MMNGSEDALDHREPCHIYSDIIIQVQGISVQRWCGTIQWDITLSLPGTSRDAVCSTEEEMG